MASNTTTREDALHANMHVLDELTEETEEETEETEEETEETEEETWRPKYLTYAFQNGLDCDDENIFRVCNEHHMERQLSDYRFECPCEADPPEFDWADDDYYGHTFCYAEGRCTRGNKMIVEWDVDNLDVGFIEADCPNGARVLRW